MTVGKGNPILVNACITLNVYEIGRKSDSSN